MKLQILSCLSLGLLSSLPVANGSPLAAQYSSRVVPVYEDCAKFGKETESAINPRPIVSLCRRTEYIPTETGWLVKNAMCQVSALDTKTAFTSDNKKANKIYVESGSYQTELDLERMICSGYNQCVLFSPEFYCSPNAFSMTLNFVEELFRTPGNNGGEGFVFSLPGTKHP